MVGGQGKKFSCQEVRIIKIFYESFYVKFINQLWGFQEVISLGNYLAGMS